jgi:aquaporin Z
MRARKLAAEGMGTAILVFLAVGTATLMFGFKLDGSSTAAGIVTTALAFGLVLVALAYAIGPISGCHVNPAVTLGFVVAGRISLTEATGYWVAQFAGGIVGAVVLWGVVSGSPSYSRSSVGLGADGYGSHSIIGLDAGGAFVAEIILTFVFVVLAVTSRLGSPGFAGLAIGLALTSVHLIGIALTGTSVNPARSLGPALVVGHAALSEVWLFIVAPLLGGAGAALIYRVLLPAEPASAAAGGASSPPAQHSPVEGGA